jgi:peptidoglycan/xylan/chitin deacetylase (PgdA/CDA1 family)
MIDRADVKWLVRSIVSSIFYYSGYCHLADPLERGGSARIFVYHSVSDGPTNSFAVTTADFDSQIGYLAEHYTIKPVDSIVALLASGQPVPARTVAVTIDDGFKGVYTNAFPVLRRYDAPATIFLPIAFVGTKGVTDKLPLADFMSWDEVREMSRYGVSFGSHTVDHPSLGRIPPRQAQYQIECSKSRLEDELGTEVTGLSYPYGMARDFNSDVVRLAETAGYSWAVSGINGVNDRNTDLFALRRTKIELYDGMRVFKKALKGALDPWGLVDRYGHLVRGCQTAPARIPRTRRARPGEAPPGLRSSLPERHAPRKGG